MYGSGVRGVMCARCMSLAFFLLPHLYIVSLSPPPPAQTPNRYCCIGSQADFKEEQGKCAASTTE
jgi:hypothetical protein